MNYGLIIEVLVLLFKIPLAVKVLLVLIIVYFAGIFLIYKAWVEHSKIYEERDDGDDFEYF